MSQSAPEPAAEPATALERRLDEAEHDLRRLRIELFTGALLRTYLSTLAGLRDLCRRLHVWPLGVSIVVAFACGAVVFVAAHVAGAALAGKLTTALLGTLCGAALCTHLFHLPPTPALAQWLQQVESQIQQLAIRRQQLLRTQTAVREEVRSAQTAEAAADRRRAEQLQSKHHLRRLLFQRNWRAMRSIEFEEFLREVFEALDFTVATTKVTGDQGVDLIVHRGRWRLAVQVKGYFHSVGNEAVQQAYAGMTHHNCHACAVITNSRFTTSAKQLAASTGCLLIDEDAMEEFIMGKLQIGLEGNGKRSVTAQGSRQTNA